MILAFASWALVTSPANTYVLITGTFPSKPPPIVGAPDWLPNKPFWLPCVGEVNKPPGIFPEVAPPPNEVAGGAPPPPTCTLFTLAIALAAPAAITPANIPPTIWPAGGGINAVACANAWNALVAADIKILDISTAFCALVPSSAKPSKPLINVFANASDACTCAWFIPCFWLAASWSFWTILEFASALIATALSAACCSTAVTWVANWALIAAICSALPLYNSNSASNCVCNAANLSFLACSFWANAVARSCSINCACKLRSFSTPANVLASTALIWLLIAFKTLLAASAPSCDESATNASSRATSASVRWSANAVKSSLVLSSAATRSLANLCNSAFSAVWSCSAFLVALNESCANFSFNAIAFLAKSSSIAIRSSSVVDAANEDAFSASLVANAKSKADFNALRCSAKASVLSLVTLTSFSFVGKAAPIVLSVSLLISLIRLASSLILLSIAVFSFDNWFSLSLAEFNLWINITSSWPLDVTVPEVIPPPPITGAAPSIDFNACSALILSFLALISLSSNSNCLIVFSSILPCNALALACAMRASVNSSTAIVTLPVKISSSFRFLKYAGNNFFKSSNAVWRVLSDNDVSLIVSFSNSNCVISFDTSSLTALLNFSCSAVAPPNASTNLSKLATNKPTATINAPIPVDINAALNVWAPVAPATNPALICSPTAVNVGPNNLPAATNELDTSLKPLTTPITPNNFFSASSIFSLLAPNAMKADDTAPTAPVKPVNVSTKAVALCSLSRPSNCKSKSFNSLLTPFNCPDSLLNSAEPNSAPLKASSNCVAAVFKPFSENFGVFYIHFK